MVRYSLASLLVLTLLAAAGCAALAYATPVWAGGAVCVALAVLVLAVLAAVFRRGRARAFWIGFALCGWVYLLLVNVPLFDKLSARLLTTRSIALLQSQFHPDAQPVDTSSVASVAISAQGNLLWTSPDSGDTIHVWDATTGKAVSPGTIVLKSDFLAIGHALWALLLACLGGLAAGILYATRGEKKKAPPEQRPDGPPSTRRSSEQAP